MENGRRLRILLIDDDALVLRALGRMLADHEVSMATDGQAALFSARTETFDVALVDLHMPGMDGFDVREALLALHPRLQVVIMTGGVSSSEWGRLENIQHIEKPFRTEELIELLEEGEKIG